MADVVFQIRSSEGVCVRGAAVLAAYPDGRYLTGQTDVHGECRHPDRKPRSSRVTYLSTTIRNHPLEVNSVHERAEGSSFHPEHGIYPRWGDCSASSGYVYGENIANGLQSLRHFEIGEALHLIDVYGVETTVRFLVVEGQFSLIEYTDPKPYGGE